MTRSIFIYINSSLQNPPNFQGSSLLFKNSTFHSPESSLKAFQIILKTSDLDLTMSKSEKIGRDLGEDQDQTENWRLNPRPDPSRGCEIFHTMPQSGPIPPHENFRTKKRPDPNLTFSPYKANLPEHRGTKISPSDPLDQKLWAKGSFYPELSQFGIYDDVTGAQLSTSSACL